MFDFNIHSSIFSIFLPIDVIERDYVIFQFSNFLNLNAGFELVNLRRETSATHRCVLCVGGGGGERRGDEEEEREREREEKREMYRRKCCLGVCIYMLFDYYCYTKLLHLFGNAFSVRP